jgi:hypothetical protein
MSCDLNLRFAATAVAVRSQELWSIGVLEGFERTISGSVRDFADREGERAQATN